MEHEVRRFWMTKLDAGLMTPLPTSDSGSAAVKCSKRINPRPQSCLYLTSSEYPSNDDDDDMKLLRFIDLAEVGESCNKFLIKDLLHNFYPSVHLKPKPFVVLVFWLIFFYYMHIQGGQK